jgi:hypothetical protein
LKKKILWIRPEHSRAETDFFPDDKALALFEERVAGLSQVQALACRARHSLTCLGEEENKCRLWIWKIFFKTFWGYAGTDEEFITTDKTHRAAGWFLKKATDASAYPKQKIVVKA